MSSKTRTRPGIVEPLKRAHKVGKRSRQDANFLPPGQSGFEERQICFVGARDQSFHDTFRNRDGPIVAGDQGGNPHRASHR